MSATAIRSLSLHRPAPLAHDDTDTFERQRRSSHPLLAAALAAFYDVGDTLHIFRRSHGCDPTDCALCNDARLAWSALQPLECGLEGELSFTDSPQLDRRRAESDRCRGQSRSRTARRWRPNCGRNHPVHVLAVMALLDLGKALESLHEGHSCGDKGCYTCEMAEVGAYLVPLVTSALERTLIPTAALLRRRGARPGRAKLLRLLEQTERS